MSFRASVLCGGGVVEKGLSCYREWGGEGRGGGECFE